MAFARRRHSLKPPPMRVFPGLGLSVIRKIRRSLSGGGRGLATPTGRSRASTATAGSLCRYLPETEHAHPGATDKQNTAAGKHGVRWPPKPALLYNRIQYHRYCRRLYSNYSTFDLSTNSSSQHTTLVKKSWAIHSRAVKN
ncbi:unnamed protein product, partial [Iphiclides podalirius]